MQRRSFLGIAALSLAPAVALGDATVQPVAHARLRARFAKHRTLYAHVMRHLFPKNDAEALVAFIETTIFHPSYDRDIRRFVITGMEDFDRAAKGRFVQLDTQAKEKALRDFEATAYGAGWLRRMLILGCEGTFGDPIYGANPRGMHWQRVGTQGGLPRPTVRYIWG